MKNKKVLFVISCVVLLIVLDRCTTVKISSASIFEKEEFKTYPFLSDGVTSDSYEIKQLVKEEESYHEITYDTLNNYFIVDAIVKTQKISAEGKVLNNIKSIYPKSDTASIYSFPNYLYNPNKSHFLIGNTRDSLVYDFSKNKIEETLTKIISTSHIKTQEEWLAFYTPYYNMADVVIYREKFENSEDVQPIYLRVDNKWILILFSGDCNLTLTEKYPKELIYLKDYNREVYSELHYSFEQTPWESTDTPEKGIEKVFFRKDHVYSRLNLYYYEVFPQVFKGIGFYNLKKGEEVLKFKNWMLQSFYFTERTHLQYYTLPERFRNKSEVTFIEHYTPADGHSFFIVKRKE